ncbi:MAG: cysteine--tRNA ligase [Candidatus Paceibacterota bacterium]
MTLKLYNTLSREKEEFKPISGMNVGLYTCGPTVYSHAHIGNFRAYVFSDMLKRYLTHTGYNVKHIMNITDVDDKTIRESQKEGKSLKEFTTFYTDVFYKDRDTLNILPATEYTKATDFISEMIKIIETLIDKGFAYKTDDGSVYFNIKKDLEYGKLVNLDKKLIIDLDGQLNNANKFSRIKTDEYEKDNIQDFALWKAWDENDGNVFWQTSLGKGRPGWHIECSAMSMSKLGTSFDIHTGGVDNIFPHHENEIAQSECSTGKQFVKYWMHNEHLMVDGKKMSKSLGNFYTLRDIIDKGISPLAFRYWLYTGHYRTKINFTLDTALGSQIALNKLFNLYKNLKESVSDKEISSLYLEKFNKAMDDDLNTSVAIAIVWELIKDSKVSDISKKSTLLYFDKVLGFGFNEIKLEAISEEVEDIAKERFIARTTKDWGKSDELRNKINKLGYEVKDIDGGYEILKI